jgi:very-short-patch-repair endonuclease
MKEITEKLHNRAMAEFMPLIEQMAKNGCTKEQIVDAYQNQLKMKTRQYYEKLKEPILLKDVFSQLEIRQTADSKAEIIFYEMLKSSGIKFTFQHVIGPYRADYLIMGFLVIEIDGPQHDEIYDERRDAYLRKMGYKIIRIPIWILMSCPEAAIDEIKMAAKGAK